MGMEDGTFPDVLTGPLLVDASLPYKDSWEFCRLGALPQFK